MDPIEVLIRLALALVIGGLIGFEREVKHNPAGLRTHILVSIGACTAMLTNEYLFLKYLSYQATDVARLASYVISGIGFLGAGTIIKDDFGIRGLTTAAGLWTTACLGIAAGSGFYFVTIAGIAIVLFSLIILKFLEGKAITYKKTCSIDFLLKNPMADFSKIYKVIKDNKAYILKMSISNKKGIASSARLKTTMPVEKKTLFNELRELNDENIELIHFE